MKPICYVSFNSYYLFEGWQWDDLLKRNGVDISRPIRYDVGKSLVGVYYDDTFIGENI